MTVETEIRDVSHDGDGATITFAVPFPFQQDSDVVAVLRDAADVETTWALNTEYSLAGAGEPGGGVLTVAVAPTDFTPAVGETLYIARAVPATQETDYVENDPFPAESHEDALDKLTMLVQELFTKLDLTFKIPVTDTQAGNFDLPIDSVRASQFLIFDALGAPTVAVGTAPTTTPLSVYVDTLLPSANAATFRALLLASTVGDALFIVADAEAAREVIGFDKQAWLLGQTFG